LRVVDKEDEIANAHAETVRRLTEEEGSPVAAVVTVVIFKDDGRYRVGAIVDPESGELGDALMEAADIIDGYVHDRGLCEECSAKGKSPE